MMLFLNTLATPEGMWDAVCAARKPPPKPKPVAIVKPMVTEKKKIYHNVAGTGE